jgi:hypothetical protein
MLKFVIPAIAALGLTAVAAQSYAPDMVQADTSPMAWYLSHEGAMAKLAYGVENSDQLALMVTCEPGQTAAVVYGDVQPTGARLTQASYGPVEPDPMSAGDAYETRISLRDPALTGLAEHGRMRVSGDGGEFTLAATDQEQRAIGEFLAYCARGRV